MNSIQVDMFEVQLGAGMLLQFRTESDRVVRVLVDAGVHASGYDEDHVEQKLPGAFGSFGEGMRIDLMVGSHYDADHLLGLVPIIENTNFEITEAWMPPVADDTKGHALEDAPTDTVMLANLFADEDGLEQLRRYVSKKKHEVDLIRELEGRMREEVFDAEDLFRTFKSMGEYREGQSAVQDWGGDDIVSWVKEIFSHELDGHEEGHCHADDMIEGAPSLKRTLNELNSYPFYEDLWWRRRFGTDPSSLAMLRKSTAKSAITATSLAKVVQALRARNIPIYCRTIDDGMPQRFVWRERENKFVPGKNLSPQGPTLSLLGPSKGLVKKHWDRLPIGEYSKMAFLASIPIKSITPSNQLSYVLRFEHNEQGILVAGDAGCVDFKPKSSKKKYYPDLLNELMPLHVVQVAHHGGNNAYFYRVLQAAKYGDQTDDSYLLLSHATNDKYRPSETFGSFLANVRDDTDSKKLLFTSKPQANKVRDYKTLISPVVGNANDEGDVRLEYGNKWQVTAHAIKVV